MPFGELVEVHFPLKGPEIRAAGALGPRAAEGVVLGFGTRSHSYIVFCMNQIKVVRSVQRKPLSERWKAEEIERVNVSCTDMHATRGARPIPLGDRQHVAEDQPARRRAARKVELRQADFDPALGGHGWTEHCPKCTHVKDYGWQAGKSHPHSEPCRRRMEEILSQTARGRARLAHTVERSDRWLAERVREGAEAAPGPPCPEAEAQGEFEASADGGHRATEMASAPAPGAVPAAGGVHDADIEDGDAILE